MSEKQQKSMKTLSSSSGTTAQVWNKLDESTDHLIYYCNGHESSTQYLKKYCKWLISTRNGDIDVLEKLVVQSAILGKKFEEVGPDMEERITETLTWLFRKIGWKPSKEQKNVGYAGYEDMLLRYGDLKKELDRMQLINKQTASVLTCIVQEHRNMCQMNEKLEELRYRRNLLEVAKAVRARANGKDDPLYSIFSLPLLLAGIIFHPDTSQSYASKLLLVCKRLLVIAEAVQYERNPKNDPIVTTSDVLKHPPQSNVPSLFILKKPTVPVAEGNGEILAPENSIAPIARDSAHTLIATDNGEVGAPEEKIVPIARDSAHTLISCENGEVTATSEIIVPIIKDSVTNVGTKISPKPILKK